MAKSVERIVREACERVVEGSRGQGHTLRQPRAGRHNPRSGELALGAMRCRDEILADLAKTKGRT